MRHVAHLLDVRASGKDALAAGDDHRIYVVTPRDLGGDRAQFLLHRAGEGVDRRAVQGDEGDAVGNIER